MWGCGKQVSQLLNVGGGTVYLTGGRFPKVEVRGTEVHGWEGHPWPDPPKPLLHT